MFHVNDTDTNSGCLAFARPRPHFLINRLIFKGTAETRKRHLRSRPNSQFSHECVSAELLIRLTESTPVITITIVGLLQPRYTYERSLYEGKFSITR